MSTCKDIDALLMDWLYDELEPEQQTRLTEHTEGCATCAAEIQSLRATRELLADLPQVEPPPGLSAMLLQEAARHAPATGDERPGFFAWLSGLFQPLVAHPAAAALATLVLVAGVAGSLYVRGVDRAAEPTLATSDSAQAPAALEKSGEGRGDDFGDRTVAGAAKDDSGAEFEAAFRSSQPASDPAPAEENRLGRVAPDSQSIVIDTADPELKEVTDERVTEEKKLVLADGKAERSREQRAGERSEAGKRKSKPRSRDAKLAKRDLAFDDVLADDEADFDDSDTAEGEEEFARPAPVVPGSVTGADAPADGVGNVRGRATQVTQKKNKAPRRPEATRKPGTAKSADRAASSGKGSGGGVFAGAPAQGTTSPAGGAGSTGSARRGDTADKSAGSKAVQKDSQSSKRSAAQRSQLVRAVKAKDCALAARIANDLRDRDPRYYSENIARSKILGSCGTRVARERQRREREREAEKAADAAAEAAEAEAAE